MSRNLPAGSMPYAGPRNSTSTDHSDHTEKPMCSVKIEKIRLRRATGAPVVAQKLGSSGRQSSIQRPVTGDRLGDEGGLRRRVELGLRGCCHGRDARDAPFRTGADAFPIVKRSPHARRPSRVRRHSAARRPHHDRRPPAPQSAPRRAASPASEKASSVRGACSSLVSISRCRRGSAIRRSGGHPALDVDAVPAAVERDRGSWSRASGGISAIASVGT